MTEQDVKIRRFQPSDEKDAQFIVAKAAMEPLAVANRRAYTHPLIIVVWLALSSGFNQYMEMWPTNNHGILGYLSPVPFLAATWVPIMFLIDWLHRPDFEAQARRLSHGQDMKDIMKYYSRSSSSGFWILEYGRILVGLVAVDASTDSLLNDTGTPKYTKGTASVATIRHFYIDEIYRRSGIQADLLNHAVRLAFESNESLEQIQSLDNPLLPYFHVCLRDAGFRFVKSTHKFGILGWQVGLRSLARTDWEVRNQDR